MTDNQIVKVLIWSKLLDEIFQVLLKEHPDIITRCIIQVVTKNPELFKKGKDEKC